MSTFKGVIDEFPDIRIDYFRKSNDPKAEPPKACFLSHIHSDHIQGLEGTYNAPFVYCSAATKELLVKLQRKTHRLNLQKNIVETEDCRYKEKKRLLKPIPLETPAMIEVGPDRYYRVTLFDANHCAGAVMFLIESDRKAILYTGDIRAEAWWVDYLARHPVLLPYSTGLRRLDKIYLDTTMGRRGYENMNSKSEGIQELLEKMMRYPDDTVFHFNTWTFGYEEVWVALSAAFKSQIHLGRYHYQLFKSISAAHTWAYGPYLCGFKLGNNEQSAVITTNPNVRLHSCERGLDCEGLRGDNVVYITPVVARIENRIIVEQGIDFVTNNQDFSLYGQIHILLDALGPRINPDVRRLLTDAAKTRKEAVHLNFNDEAGERPISMQELMEMLLDVAQRTKSERTDTWQGDQMYPGTTGIKGANGELLPTWITFPYSRHSSFGELRNFVGAFRPADIHQCVIEEADWTENISVESLYGDLCEGKEFSHDAEMRFVYEARIREEQIWLGKLVQYGEQSQQRDIMSSQHTEDRPSSPLPEAKDKSLSPYIVEEDPSQRKITPPPLLRDFPQQAELEATPQPLQRESPSPSEKGEETQQLEHLEAMLAAQEQVEEIALGTAPLMTGKIASARWFSSSPALSGPSSSWERRDEILQMVTPREANREPDIDVVSAPLPPYKNTETQVQYQILAEACPPSIGNIPNGSPMKPRSSLLWPESSPNHAHQTPEGPNKRRKVLPEGLPFPIPNSSKKWTAKSMEIPDDSASETSWEDGLPPPISLPVMKGPKSELQDNTQLKYNNTKDTKEATITAVMRHSGTRSWEITTNSPSVEATTTTRRKRCNPKSPSYPTELVCELPSTDLDKRQVKEAVHAAMGLNGKSWWDVDLQSTAVKWRYEAEEEL